MRTPTTFSSEQLAPLADSGFALAMQLLRHREDAADAVQDALQTVLRKRRLFRPERGELRSWFLKIVRNRCLDMLRRRDRQEVSASELPEPAGPDRQRPDNIAEQSELLRLLKSVLMDMPREQRELIVLRDYHNLSYAELADVLSIPAGTVMSRLHRARKELAGRMQRYR